MVGLIWFPAERLDPARRLPHVDTSVVQGRDISEDMHGVDEGAAYVDFI